LFLNIQRKLTALLLNHLRTLTYGTFVKLTGMIVSIHLELFRTFGRKLRQRKSFRTRCIIWRDWLR